MKRLYLPLLLLLLSCCAAQAQVTVISPTGDGGFETGTTLAANGWNYVGHATINAWYVGNVAFSAGSRGCYVGQSVSDNNGGNGAPTTNHIYRDVTIPAGATNVQLSFKLRYTTSEPLWDRFCVSVFPTSVVPTTGSYGTAYPYTGSVGTATLPGSTAMLYENSNVYSSFVVVNSSTPAGTYSTAGTLLNLTSYAGSTFRLVFTFTNADQWGTAGNPAIDEISLTYTPPSPSAPVSPSSLAFGGVLTGTSSLAQTFTVSGSYLSPAAGNLTVTAPANFEVSSNGITWVSSYTIPYTSSTLAATTGYVRFNPTAAIAYSGNVTVTGGGLATSSNVAVTGTGAAACSGTPTAGSASASPTLAGSTTPITVSLSGYTSAAGLTYQWQSSPDGTTGWTNISGATNLTYATTGISTTTYYRCVVSCGAASANSSSAMVSFLPPSPTCIPTGASWSWASGTTYGLNGLTINGFSGSTLSDVGIVAATSTANGYLNRTALTPVNLQQNGVYASSGTWGSVAGYQYLCVWIDFNNNGTFEASEAVSPLAGGISGPPQPTTFNISIPAGAAPGLHLMRVRAIWENIGTTLGVIPPAMHPCNLNNGSNPSYYSGTVTDYYVNIVPLPVCSGTPATGTVIASVTTGCNTYTSNLSLSLGATGQTYQWQSSPNNTTWTNISGATNAGYTATVTANTYYRCIVTCTASGLSSTSPSAYLTFSSCILMATSGTNSTTLCSGLFYDNGGPTGLYNNGCNATHTFYPGVAGSKVRMVFSSFSVEGDPWDYMDIYNGNSTGAPSLGHFTTSSPGTITSTAADGSLTVRFVSDPSVNLSGWEATISNVHTTPITVQPATTTNACQSIPVSIGLTATGTVTYQWYDNGTTNSNTGGTLIAGANSATYSPSTTAIGTKYYYCVVTNACGIAFASNAAGVEVVALPPAITGGSAVCEGLTTAFTNAVTTGTWTSSSTGVATVSGSGGTGTITGVGAGTSVITYATSPACYVTKSITVNASPAPIGGASFQLCEAGTATLTHPDGGTGTWSSVSPSVATIGLSSGIVNGISSGYATISYVNIFGCATTRQITVNPLPVVSITPATSSTVCLGNGTTFTATSAAPQLLLMSQNFNSGLAGWTVTNGTGSAASWWQIVSAPGAASFAGDGTPYLQAAANTYLTDATVTTITSPSFSTTGGFATVNLSFNQYLFSFAPDVAASIEYSIDGGTSWTLIANQALSVVSDAGDDGNWNASTPEYTVALPGAALGQNNVRIRLVYNAQSLYWLVDNITVKGVMPASTFAWTGAAGLSCASCPAPTITPTTTGTNAYNLAITSSAGCITNTPVTMTVNPNPSAITGSLTICEGVTGALSSTTGGTWTSGSTANATVTSGGGAITGVAAGTADITYILSTTGCRTTAVATVLAAPAAIAPATVSICNGNNATLTNTTTGGTWVSSNTAVANISSTGVVSSVGIGNTNITYTIPTGCIAVRSVTVNPLPAAITGASTVCVDNTTTLSNTDILGTWSSSNTAVATVNSSTGVVTGVAQGNVFVTYTLPTGCYTVKAMQVNPLPLAITGASSVCVGLSTVLSTPSLGGVWSSSAPGIAAVDASGIVTGGLAGTASISYTYPLTGCSALYSFTVNPLPVAITGTQKVCKNATVTFSNADAFGTWTSADASIASVDAATGVITGVAPGNTRITYTLPTGCINTRTVTVNPLPNNINGASAVCYGSTTNLTNTTPLGTWTSSDASVATISSGGLVSPVNAAGGVATISFTVTNSGCYTTRDITVNPLPSTIGGSTVLCAGSNVTLTNADAGGTWASSNTGVFTISGTGDGVGVSAGNANVTYTLPTGCRRSTPIVVNGLPADIIGNETVCPGRQTTLITTSTGGNWSSSNPTIATVSSSGVVTGVAAGATNITYMFGTGCYRTLAMTVNPLPAPITGTFAICAGTTTTLSNADMGGTWVSSLPVVATIGVLGNVVAGYNAGPTVITYTLPTGCFRTQALMVNPLPASITGTATVCEGASTTLNNTTTGGTWSSSDATIASVDDVTGLVSGIAQGAVTVSYTLNTGCFRTRSFVVNPMPSSIGGTTSACLGGNSTLSATPVNGVWSSGSASVASINSAGVVTANAAGVTTMTYTLPAGCRTTTSFVVNPLPAAITGTRVLCNGATTTLANASAGGNWSTGNPLVADIDATSGELTGNGAGVTTVTYTLPTGCTRSANVTVNALPATITGNMAVCEGSTTQLATTSNGGTWSSDNTAVATVSNSGVVSGIAAGGANIAYTLPTGCRTTTAVVVNALPDNITGATSVCLGQQATVLNSTAGGTWTSSNSGIADVDGTGAVTGMGVGTAVLRYTVTATGCSRTKSFVVNPLPAAITGTMSVCQGSTTTLGNASAGGSWSSSNSSIASISAGGNVAGLAVGFSIITYTLPTGCSVSNTMVVNALPEPITGTAVMCAGGNTTLESNTMGGTWSSSNSNTSVTSAGVVTGLASGTSVITYMTGNGCRRIRSVTVNALPGLITGAGSVCPGQTLALGNSVSGGTWSSDNTAVATVDVNGVVTPATTAGGTAFIAYTLPTGCVRSRQITVHPAVEAITGTGTICRMGTTMLSNATAGGVWTSSNAAIAAVDAAGMVSGAGAGAATIVYTIPATGCKSEMTVVVNPLPGNISGAAAVCVGSTVVLSNTVPGGSWSTGDTTVTITGSGVVSGLYAGNAMLTYTLPTGCNVTRSIVVNALPVVKNVTGGGSYCAGGNGVAVGIDGSEAGTIYKLMNGGSTPVITMMGSGSGAVDFGLQTGAGSYMVTAVSAAGCMRDMSGSAVVSVTPLVTPEVSLTSDKGSSVCAGTAVTYSAAAVNGGSAPVYEWRVNGAIAGTGASYSYNPADGDVVQVQLTSNATCPSVAKVSTELAMTVRANLTPAIAVTANPGNNICAGTAVTYSAAGVNGGSAPVYTWVVNGAPVAGATNTVYSYQPSNGDVVLCRLTSSYGCVTTNDVASNSTTMSVAPVFVPEVEVVANPGTVVPAGTEVTFTTVVNNAGPAPTYQWLINAIPVNGATQPVFKTSNLRNGDSVTCRVSGAGACSKTTINSVLMTITPATGVGQVNLMGSDLRLYPNPNTGVFEVRGTVGVKTDVEAQLEVTNVLGQVVYRGSARTRGGELEARIELGGNMANGMYLLNVTVGESRQSFHFVVKQ